MKPTLILAALLPLCSAAGIRYTSPTLNTTWQSGSTVTITWVWDALSATAWNLPNTVAGDNITFVLEDLRNGENTGVPIGAPIATALVTAQTATGKLPVVPAGTHYTIRGAAGRPATWAFSNLFSINATAAAAGGSKGVTGADQTGSAGKSVGSLVVPMLGMCAAAFMGL
ncbi:hypothetical protein HK104_008500 [Borealophlyctis nickersoniae]|nr:hypothetical protein HK104_008500 [Borealophlyctis nickersoniae]